jgi:hypothetical protein
MAAKKKAAKKAKRTVMYSKGGKKLYAKRDGGGKFTDIQTYARAHAADLRKTNTKNDKAAAKKTAAKKAKKTVAKKTVAKKTVAKKK